MKSIWKFRLQVADEQIIEMPSNAVVLTVQIQQGAPCLWAMVDRDAPKAVRKFITHGTGHDVSEAAGQYIGSYQLHNGGLVFHVFEAA